MSAAWQRFRSDRKAAASAPEVMLTIERFRSPSPRAPQHPGTPSTTRAHNQRHTSCAVRGSCDSVGVGDLIGYARVSTADQDPVLQLDALHAAGCIRVFADRASGTIADRPQLARALDHLRPGDTLTVWKLDRLGRNLRHLIETVRDLEERGVDFRSLQESIDTTTPGGRLVFHVLASLAEFERDLIRERTYAGLTAARARGRNGGRPTVMTAEKTAIARQMYDARSHTVAAIAATVGVSRATIYRALGPAAATA
jgi:DNA invertase Pin-like site-specific DNA recombinase